MERKHANRGEVFQISNGRRIGDRSVYRFNKTDGRAAVKGNGELILRDFIEGNKDIVDEEIMGRFRLGDKQAITEALNQFHWKSLRLNKIEDVLRDIINDKGEMVLTTTKSFAK